MAENSSGNGGLYFIVGGLVVIVGLGIFAFSGGYIGGHGGKTSIERTTVSAPAVNSTTTTTTEKTSH